MRKNREKTARNSKKTKLRTILVRSSLVFLMLVVLTAAFSAVCYHIIHSAGEETNIFTRHLDTLNKRDVAIVPGTAVTKTSPTPKCRERLDMAVTLYEKKLVSSILVSGTKKETTVMCLYLMQHGIPKNVLFRDSMGLSTYDTISRAACLMEGKKFYFCTQEMYTDRASFLMKQSDMDGIPLCVDTMFYNHAGKANLREYLAATKAVIDSLLYQGNPKHDVETDGFSKLPKETDDTDNHHVSPADVKTPDDCLVTDKNPTDGYDVIKAVEYARKYALQANPAYPVFENNCTNFVSQCLVAGGISMEGSKEVSTSKRLTVSGGKKDWFSTAETKENGMPHYGTSSNFINTDDFISYITEVRGYPLSSYENTYDGKLSCYEAMASGDVIILYASDGTVAHLGLITGIGDMNAYYCGNTTGRLDFCIFTANPAAYPRLGIIHMSK